MRPTHDPDVIRINDRIGIRDEEVTERFIRAAGPGGQNVNKLATAVQLRFDARRSPSLPEDVRARLETLAGRRLTREGVLVITAQRHRTQEGNRRDALARLVDLIQRAAVAPVPRRPTKPSKAAREQRLEAKKRHSSIKRLRHSKAEVE
jgi:ribosome-associated protein